MAELPINTPRATQACWTYGTAVSDDAVEVATVIGRDVALPAHFHDDDQITFVLSGRRRFLLEGEITTIGAGRAILLPARSVHRSLPEPAGVICLNLYLRGGDYAAAAMMGEIEARAQESGGLGHDDLLAIVSAHRLGWRMDAPLPAVSHRGVAARAAQAGVTREGFSRAFARHHDMPPHAFAVVARLNHARRLLRHGAPIAAVACDAGFADQSHLGRAFRRVFGVTPGRYRMGR